MKLKINKACDLSSISVLPPPQSRRPNSIPSGTESSIFSKMQASQLRAQQSQQSFSQLRQQQSQQSFSQPISSQFSQSSLDEILTNDQRFGSQEKENSTKRFSCLAPVSYTREESQMPGARSSNNHIRQWGSAPVPDHRCQVSEELEHKIGQMETSLNRFGMILDSVQSDVVQVNKSIKNVALETEGIKKELIGHDGSLQLMLTREEDIKACLEGSLKSIPEQVRKDLHQFRLEESFLTLLALPEQVEVRLLKMQSEVCRAIVKEVEAIVSKIRSPIQKYPGTTVLQETVRSIKSPNQENLEPSLQGERNAPLQSQREEVPVPEKPFISVKGNIRKFQIDKTREGRYSLKPKPESFAARHHNVNYKQEEIPFTEQDRQWRIVIESDEESDRGFSCLLAEKGGEDLQSNLVEEVKDETERILRKARKRKRKHCHPITIN